MSMTKEASISALDELENVRIVIDAAMRQGCPLAVVELRVDCDQEIDLSS
jgi:hypothetical protein